MTDDRQTDRQTNRQTDRHSLPLLDQDVPPVYIALDVVRPHADRCLQVLNRKRKSTH